MMKVADAGDVQLGRQRSPKDHTGPYMRPYLRVANVYEDRLDLTDVKEMNFSPEEFKTFELRPGDILLNEGQSKELVGRPAMYRGEIPGACFQNTLIRFRASDSVVPEYALAVFRYYMRTGEFQGICKWTTNIAHLGAQRFAAMDFPVPPLNEQNRIAAKLRSLIDRVDRCRISLERVPDTLNRFREAVLEAAVSGRLTDEWRNRREFAKTSEQQVVEREVSKSDRSRVRSLAAVENLALGDLPSGWSWIQNYRLAQDRDGAICAGPFGTIFKAKDFRSEGVPIIFLRHVAAGRYLKKKPGYMDPEVWRERHQPYSVYGGELLVTKLGDPPGTACIYPDGEGVAMVTPDVMKMSVDGSIASSRYLMHFFNSPVSTKLLKELAFGVTRLRIDLAMFKTFPIPLPTVDEQHEIVRRVDELFELAAGLERQHQIAVTQVERLIPSLLSKGFRGELVPQDPADEPASVMLERLRKSRKEAGATPKRERKTVPDREGTERLKREAEQRGNAKPQKMAARTGSTMSKRLSSERK